MRQPQSTHNASLCRYQDNKSISIARGGASPKTSGNTLVHIKTSSSLPTWSAQIGRASAHIPIFLKSAQRGSFRCNFPFSVLELLLFPFVLLSQILILLEVGGPPLYIAYKRINIYIRENRRILHEK